MVFFLDILQKYPSIITSALSVLDSFFKKRTQHDPQKNTYDVESTIIIEKSKSVFKKYEYKGSVDGYKYFIDYLKNDCND